MGRYIQHFLGPENPLPSFEKVWKLQARFTTLPPKALALCDFILICRHLLLCKAVLTKVHYQDC